MTTSGEWQPAEDFQPDSTNVKGSFYGFAVFPTANSPVKGLVPLITLPKGSESAKDLSPGPSTDVAFRPKRQPDGFLGGHRNSATCDVQMYRGIDASLSQGKKECIRGREGGLATQNTPLRLREVSFKLDSEEDSHVPSVGSLSSSAPAPKLRPTVLRSKSETKIKPFMRENHDGNLTPERSYSLNGSAHTSATNLSSFKGMTSPLAEDEGNASDVSKAAAFISSVVQQSLCPEKLSAQIHALKRERYEPSSVRKARKPITTPPYFGASNTSGYNGAFSSLAKSKHIPTLSNNPELTLVPSLKNAIAVNTIISHLNSSKPTFPKALIEPFPCSSPSVSPGLFCSTSLNVTKETDVTPSLSPPSVPISSEPNLFQNTVFVPTPNTPYIPPQSHKEAVSILTSHITPLIKPDKRTSFVSTLTNVAPPHPIVSLPQCAVTHCTSFQTTVNATSSKTTNSTLTLKEDQFLPNSVISPETHPLSEPEDSNSIMEEQSQKKSGSFPRGKGVKNKAMDIAHQLDSRLACHTYSTKFPMDVICQGRLFETRRKTPDDLNSVSSSHAYRPSRSMSTGRMEFGRRRNCPVFSAEDTDEPSRLEREMMEPEITRPSFSGPEVDAPDNNVRLTGSGNAAYIGNHAIKEENPVARPSTIATVHARSRLPKLRTSHSFNVKLVEANGANLGVKDTPFSAPFIKTTDIDDSHVDVPAPIGESSSLSDVEEINASTERTDSRSHNENNIGGEVNDFPNLDSELTVYPTPKMEIKKLEFHSDPVKERHNDPTPLPASSNETKDGFASSLIEGQPETGARISVTEFPSGPGLKSVTETFYSVDTSSLETTLEQQILEERKVVEDVRGTRTFPLDLCVKAHGKKIAEKQEDGFSHNSDSKDFANIQNTPFHSGQSWEPQVIATRYTCPGLHDQIVQDPSPISGFEAPQSPREDSSAQFPAAEESTHRSESQDPTSRIFQLNSLLHHTLHSEANVSCAPKAKDPTAHCLDPKNFDSHLMNTDLSEARSRQSRNSPLHESQRHEDPKDRLPTPVNSGISDGTEHPCEIDAASPYLVDNASAPPTLNTPGNTIEIAATSGVYQGLTSGEGLYQVSLPEPVRPLTFVVEEMFEFIDDNAPTLLSPPTAIPSMQASGLFGTGASTTGLPVQDSNLSFKENKRDIQESALTSIENIPPVFEAPSLAPSISFPLSLSSLTSPNESSPPQTRSTMTTAVFRITTPSQSPISQEVRETFVLSPSKHKAELVWVQDESVSSGDPVSPPGFPSMSSIRSSVDHQMPLKGTTPDCGDIWGSASPETDEDDFESMDAEMRRLEEKLRKFEAELGIVSLEKEEVGGSNDVPSRPLHQPEEDLMASSSLLPVNLQRTRHLSLEREASHQILFDSSSKEVDSKRSEKVVLRRRRRSLDLQKLLLHRRPSRSLEGHVMEGEGNGHGLDDEVDPHKSCSGDKLLTLRDNVVLEEICGLVSSGTPHFGYLWREGDMTALDFEALESFVEPEGNSGPTGNLFFIFEDDDDDSGQDLLEGAVSQLPITHWDPGPPPIEEDSSERSREVSLVTAFKKGLRKAAKYLGPNSPSRAKVEDDVLTGWAYDGQQSWGRYDVRTARVTKTCPPPTFDDDNLLISPLEDDLHPPPPSTASSSAEVHAYPVLCVLSSSEDDLKYPGSSLRPPPVPPRRGIPASSPQAPPRDTQPQLKRRRQEEWEEAPISGGVPTPDRPSDLSLTSPYFPAALTWPLGVPRVAAWPRRFTWHYFFAGLLLIGGLLLFTARLSVGP